MKVRDAFVISLNLAGEGIPRKIELAPLGQITGRDGRRWRLSDAERVIKNSLNYQPRLVVDFNHSTDLAAPNGGESPAAGWIHSLRAEGGSVWGEVEWTPRGEEALRRREYSFVSPVFMSEGGEINCILRAALTNNPNLDLPALNAAEGNDNEERRMTKELCAALGIPETATEADALKAVAGLKQQVDLNAAWSAKAQQVDLAVYAPRAEVNAALEKAAQAEKRLAELNAAQFKKEAEAAVDGAIKEGKFPPASRELYIGLCANQEGLETFKKIAAASPSLGGGEQAPAGAPPGGSVSLNAAEAVFAGSMGYTAEQWAAVKAGKTGSPAPEGGK